MSYNPDDNAKPDGRLFTRQLSQRDLALTIPVNFVQQAGISLTAACFSNDDYLVEPAERCFSNLLAIGFHRFEIDIYWDVSRRIWSLCPVQLGEDPTLPGDQFGTSSPPTTASTQTAISLSMVSISSSGNAASITGNARREASMTEATSSAATSPEASGGASEPTASLPVASSSATDSALAQPSESPQGSVRQIGPYSCNSAVNLDWLSGILSSYLETTETNLNATLAYAILNLHAATSAEDPTGNAEAPSPEQLSASGLSTAISLNLSSLVYTPSELQQQRANINGSWFDANRRLEPMPGYYIVEGPQTSTSTPDGWPSENFVEMSQGKRLFVGFGDIDPEMDAYDISQDAETIFPPYYLQSARPLTTTAAGEILDGCFYLPDSFNVSSVNNSWAFSDQRLNLDPPFLLTSLANQTSCGVSPVLVQPLQNITADQDFRPYQDYIQSTLWSWAPGFPTAAEDIESADASENDDDLGYENRCAAMNISTGFWQNAVCNNEHHSACRRTGSLYEWAISRQSASYDEAGTTCPDDTAFDVPRTGLQNTYLLRSWERTRVDRDQDTIEDELLWVDFNNLDSEPCWVVGQNSTCPYVQRAQNNSTVAVPTTAAVILFALGVLTILVKCVSNRRNSKRRRRRGDDGWDYEGVPS